MSDAETIQTVKPKRTFLASISGIILVVPAFIPAGIVANIYKMSLCLYLTGDWFEGSWIEKITMSWFPELLRGILVGVITLLVCAKAFKNSNTKVVSCSVMAFWSAFSLLLGAGNIIEHGLNLEKLDGMNVDIVGLTALTAGLGIGLFQMRHSMQIRAADD